MLAGLALDVARTSSATIDEFVDIPAGLAGWRLGDFAMDARNPPLLKLLTGLPAHLLDAELPPPGFRRPEVGWWPWIHGTRFLRDNAARFDRLVFLGRLPVIALTVLLGGLLWRASARLHGERGGLLSLALWAFCPTAIAHGSLATTDLGASFLFFACALAADSHQRHGGRLALILTGLLAGAALATKFSTVLLFPALMIGFALGARGGPARRLGFALSRIAVTGVLSLVVLQLAYFGPGAVRLGDGPELRSPVLGTARALVPGLWLPVPGDFLRGFDDALAYSRDPELPGYLDGVWSRDGFRRYHLEAFLIKEPLALIALVALALLVRRSTGRGIERPLLLVPPLLMLLSLVTWNRVQYGLRYALPLYPFLFLWAGRAAALAARPAGRATLLALVGLLAASVLRIHPHELSYFNRLGGGPEQGWRRLADSNVDWGQDLRALARRLEQRHAGRTVKLAYFGHVDPAHYGIRYEVLGGREQATGLVAVSASYLAGEPYAITWQGIVPVPVPGGLHSWLGAERPIDRVGYSIYLYEIP